MKSSGEIREFASGAIRDSAKGKPRTDLIPDDLMERVAFLYGKGADAYMDNNWRKGQPESAVLGSLKRHIRKWEMGMTDEDHLAAMVWNCLSLMNADMYYKDDEKICDVTGPKPWFKDGKPTGYGSYENRIYHEELKKKKETGN